MATIKSYTDLSQSKKLAEILPLESADMIWILANPDLPMIKAIAYEDSEKSKYYEVLPAWSLVALLNALPNGIVMNKDSQNGRYHFSSTHVGTYVIADNPIDACVAVIEKLHELKVL